MIRWMDSSLTVQYPDLHGTVLQSLLTRILGSGRNRAARVPVLRIDWLALSQKGFIVEKGRCTPKRILAWPAAGLTPRNGRQEAVWQGLSHSR